MEIQDQLKRKIKIPKIPERIVSLVPSQTELLIDLGLENRIVGITKFCVHPEYLRKTRKVVGGTKQVHLDKIKSLKPDIILCNKEENTREMVLELEEIAPVHVSDIYNLEDAYELMRQYAVIFNKTALAETFISSIEKKIAVLQEQLKLKPKKRVAYLIWKKPLMVAGKETFIDTLLELNNFENVFETGRYPETSLEELKSKDIDLLLLSSEPFPFQEKHKQFFSEINVPALLVDGEYFSWYGSRLIKAIDYFKELQIQLTLSSS